VQILSIQRCFNSLAKIIKVIGILIHPVTRDDLDMLGVLVIVQHDKVSSITIGHFIDVFWIVVIRRIILVP